MGNLSRPQTTPAIVRGVGSTAHIGFPGGLSASADATSAAASAAAAIAVGNTNDTIIAGRVNDPTSATAGALAASIVDASPVPESVRVTAATMPVFTKKLQLSLHDQAPCRILCVGDSTTGGVYGDLYTTTAPGSTNQGGPNSYPARLVEYLNAAGIPAIYAMGVPGHTGNLDSRWAMSSAAYATVGAGSNSAIGVGGSGSYAEFTPGVAADSYKVYYFGDTGTGDVDVTATGGSTAHVATAHGTPGFYSVSVAAGAVDAANTLRFAWAAGSTAFIAAVEYWDGSNPNQVRVLPAGVGGSKSSDWAANNASGSTAGSGGLPFIAAIAPDLSLISLGLNDFGAGRSPAAVWADVQTVVGTADNSGDVLLMSCIPANVSSASYADREAVNALYRASALPYVDLQKRWGRTMYERGLLTSDLLHPNALGYGDMAAVVARTLVTVAGAGRTPLPPTPTVTALTLLNSWVDYGGSHPTAAVWNEGYRTYLRGDIKNGAAGLAAPICVLPVGSRPLKDKNRVVYTVEGSTTTIARLLIAADGRVYLLDTANNDIVTIDCSFERF